MKPIFIKISLVITVLIAFATVIWFVVLPRFMPNHATGEVDPCTIKDSAQYRSASPKERTLLDQIAAGCHAKPLTSSSGQAIPVSTFIGTRFSFSYPNDYIVKSDDTSNGEAVFLARSFHGSNSIAVAIQPFSDSLTEYPAVHLRQINPKIYTESDYSLANLSALRFAADGPDVFERSLFTLNSGNLTSVAVSTNGPNTFLSDDFNIVVSSFQWK